MEEYVALTVRSAANESEADFASRLIKFWTHMLRDCKDDFEQVYAETTSFLSDGDCLCRTYLAGESVLDLLTRELKAWKIDHGPIDPSDVYSKYEAVAPEWMQIEH